jgi:5'-3' exoribonuclease 1
VFTELVATRPSGHYYPSHILCRRLGLNGLQLSKICSTLMVKLENDGKVNIGIPMKFESKGLKVLGYTKRNDRGWEYSETAARALERYRTAFPEVFNNLGAGGEGELTRV